jgi:malonyl-CoA O-methyltransferase
LDYDRTSMPAAYDAGRGYPPEVLQSWLATISAAVGAREIGRILDLGCGTGRYSAALAAHFGAEVFAVDPSGKMLEQARAKSAKGVRFLRGSGEAIPLADDAVDMVFISMVFHHFGDPFAAARECRRVLREGGAVCLRGGAVERSAEYAYVPFFPSTPGLLAASLTSLARIESAFFAAGFSLAHHETVMSQAAPNWRDYADKTAFRADSILAQLSDHEFTHGLEALRVHAAGAPPDRPVTEPVDFYVFG